MVEFSEFPAQVEKPFVGSLLNHSDEHFPLAVLFHLEEQGLQTVEGLDNLDEPLAHGVDEDAAFLQGPVRLVKHLDVAVALGEAAANDDDVVAVVLNVGNRFSRARSQILLPTAPVNLISIYDERKRFSI